MMIKNLIVSFFIFFTVSLISSAQQSPQIVIPQSNDFGVISLAGKWKFQFDPQNKGLSEEWYNKNISGDEITLPGTTDEQNKGEAEPKQSGRFTRIHAYRGAAWYQMNVVIPENFQGKRLVFSMERSKVTKVWFDGKLIGASNSLITTQKFQLTQSAKAGKHQITVRVHNGQEENPPVGGNHQVNDGTQTNWNGILGKIQIKATDAVWIDNVKVYPDIDKKVARILVSFGNLKNKSFKGKLKLTAKSWNSSKTHIVKPMIVQVNKTKSDSVAEITYPIGDNMLLWSEFSPALYRLSVEFNGKSDGKNVSDSRETDFGMRKFHTKGISFAINNDITFLRGKHDGAVFPDKGYPPMDVNDWLKIFRTLQSYGINHIRCHSWCPPAAAFEASDILGIYMLPELPHWGGVGNKPKVIEGDVEQKTEVYDNTTQYLIKEGYRLFDEFGNHPSFVMFEIGNELSGNRDEIANIVEKFKKYDPRHLFAGGANIFLTKPRQMSSDDFWTTTMTGGTYGSGVYTDTKGKEVRSSYPSHKEGHVNNILEGTDYDYSSGIKDVTIPVVSHESGQYQVYPNFKEIDKFTGVTRAYNFETYRDRLKAAGMLDLANDFFKASGALAVICYREEIESSIRTRGFGGFQLLDLQDYPGQGTALVGILDSHLESKGLITPQKWREFCNSVVPLLRHDSFTWTNDQTFHSVAEIANYGPVDINEPISWVLKDDSNKEIARGEFPKTLIRQGGLTKVGEITQSLNVVKSPQKLEVTLFIKGTEYRNSYSIWVYPSKVDISVPSSVKIFYSFNEEAKNVLKNGGKVLILPTKEAIPTSIDGAFQTDFWCYAMFRKYNPPGTLGILCNPKHPALTYFPTDFHSDWQWWRLLKNGRPINMATLPKEYRPIVQVIDNVTTNRKLGVLFEAKVGNGSLLICSMDLQNQQSTPEGKQMLHSLLRYMDSNQFNPSTALSVNEIASVITEN